MSEEKIERSCGDCGRPFPMVDGVLSLRDHAEDCAGVERKIIAVHEERVPA